MADDQTITLTDEKAESLKTKFQGFLEGLDEDENAIFAAMVSGGEQRDDEEVSGYWYNWGGWGNWWNQSNSVIASGGGNVIASGGGNWGGWRW